MTAAARPTKPTSRWALLIVLNLVLLLHLSVYLLGSFPEFDSASRLKLGIGVLTALARIVLAVVLQRRSVVVSERWHTPSVLAATAFLLVLALIPVPPYTYPYFAHVHLLLTLAVSLWLLYGALFDGSRGLRRARLWLIVGIVGALAVSLIRVYGLSVYPFVDVQDEAWTTAWTVNWMRTGHFGDPTLGGLGDAYYAYPRFYWLMGLWMKLVGVGLWQGRLLGFLLIFPVIGLTVLVARAWYGKASAVFTGFFMLASAVLMSAARIRHDIGLTLCLAGSLALFTLASKRRSPFLHFAAGLIMAWGTFSHYHGVGLSVAVWIGLYAPRYVAQVRARATWHFWLPEPGAWLFAFGAFLGGLSVLFIQMIPDDLPGWLWALQHQSLYSRDSGEFFISLFGNIFNIGFFSIFELLLVVAAVVAALRRRTQFDVSLLLILVLGLIVLAVMGSGAIYYYILPLMPVYSLLIGRLFLGGKQSTRESSGLPRRQVVLFLLCLMPLLGASTGRSLEAVIRREPIDPVPPAAVQWIRDHVPPSDKVVADMYYYFWLKDYRFTSHLVPDFLYPENIARYPTIEAVWEAVDMDYLVVDPNFTRSYVRYFQPLIDSGLIARKYTVAAEIPTDKGVVTIYQRTAPR